MICFFIYRYSIKHVTSFQSEELFENSADKRSEVHYPESVNNKFGSTLELYLLDERPSLNPSLTLQNLAIALNTNRTYLSEYFNKTLGTTFYDHLIIRK